MNSILEISTAIKTLDRDLGHLNKLIYQVWDQMPEKYFDADQYPELNKMVLSLTELKLKIDSMG